MTVCETCLNLKKIRVFATDADKRNHHLNVDAKARLHLVRYNIVPCPKCGKVAE